MASGRKSPQRSATRTKRATGDVATAPHGSRPEQVYVRASTVIVPFDFEAQRPRRITAEERAYLEEYTDDEDDSAGAVAA